MSEGWRPIGERRKNTENDEDDDDAPDVPAFMSGWNGASGWDDLDLDLEDDDDEDEYENEKSASHDSLAKVPSPGPNPVAGKEENLGESSTRINQLSSGLDAPPDEDRNAPSDFSAANTATNAPTEFDKMWTELGESSGAEPAVSSTRDSAEKSVQSTEHINEMKAAGFSSNEESKVDSDSRVAAPGKNGLDVTEQEPHHSNVAQDIPAEGHTASEEDGFEAGGWDELNDFDLPEKPDDSASLENYSQSINSMSTAGEKAKQAYEDSSAHAEKASNAAEPPANNKAETTMTNVEVDQSKEIGSDTSRFFSDQVPGGNSKAIGHVSPKFIDVRAVVQERRPGIIGRFDAVDLPKPDKRTELESEQEDLGKSEIGLAADTVTETEDKTEANSEILHTEESKVDSNAAGINFEETGAADTWASTENEQFDVGAWDEPKENPLSIGTENEPSYEPELQTSEPEVETGTWSTADPAQFDVGTWDEQHQNQMSETADTGIADEPAVQADELPVQLNVTSAIEVAHDESNPSVPIADEWNSSEAIQFGRGTVEEQNKNLPSSSVEHDVTSQQDVQFEEPTPLLDEADTTCAEADEKVEVTPEIWQTEKGEVEPNAGGIHFEEEPATADAWASTGFEQFDVDIWNEQKENPTPISNGNPVEAERTWFHSDEAPETEVWSTGDHAQLGVGTWDNLNGNEMAETADSSISHKPSAQAEESPAQFNVRSAVETAHSDYNPSAPNADGWASSEINQVEPGMLEEQIKQVESSTTEQAVVLEQDGQVEEPVPCADAEENSEVTTELLQTEKAEVESNRGGILIEEEAAATADTWTSTGFEQFDVGAWDERKDNPSSVGTGNEASGEPQLQPNDNPVESESTWFHSDQAPITDVWSTTDHAQLGVGSWNNRNKDAVPDIADAGISHAPVLQADEPARRNYATNASEFSHVESNPSVPNADRWESPEFSQFEPGTLEEQNKKPAASSPEHVGTPKPEGQFEEPAPLLDAPNTTYTEAEEKAEATPEIMQTEKASVESNAGGIHFEEQPAFADTWASTGFEQFDDGAWNEQKENPSSMGIGNDSSSEPQLQTNPVESEHILFHSDEVPRAEVVSTTDRAQLDVSTWDNRNENEVSATAGGGISDEPLAQADEPPAQLEMTTTSKTTYGESNPMVPNEDGWGSSEFNQFKPGTVEEQSNNLPASFTENGLTSKLDGQIEEPESQIDEAYTKPEQGESNLAAVYSGQYPGTSAEQWDTSNDRIPDSGEVFDVGAQVQQLDANNAVSLPTHSQDVTKLEATATSVYDEYKNVEQSGPEDPWRDHSFPVNQQEAQPVVGMVDEVQSSGFTPKVEEPAKGESPQEDSISSSFYPNAAPNADPWSVDHGAEVQTEPASVPVNQSKGSGSETSRFVPEQPTSALAVDTVTNTEEKTEATSEIVENGNGKVESNAGGIYFEEAANANAWASTSYEQFDVGAWDVPISQEPAVQASEPPAQFDLTSTTETPLSEFNPIAPNADGGRTSEFNQFESGTLEEQSKNPPPNFAENDVSSEPDVQFEEPEPEIVEANAEPEQGKANSDTLYSSQHFDSPTDPWDASNNHKPESADVFDVGPQEDQLDPNNGVSFATHTVNPEYVVESFPDIGKAEATSASVYGEYRTEEQSALSDPWGEQSFPVSQQEIHSKVPMMVSDVQSSGFTPKVEETARGVAQQEGSISSSFYSDAAPSADPWSADYRAEVQTAPGSVPVDQSKTSDSEASRFVPEQSSSSAGAYDVWSAYTMDTSTPALNYTAEPEPYAQSFSIMDTGILDNRRAPRASVSWGFGGRLIVLSSNAVVPSQTKVNIYYVDSIAQDNVNDDWTVAEETVNAIDMRSCDLSSYASMCDRLSVAPAWNQSTSGGSSYLWKYLALLCRNPRGNRLQSSCNLFSTRDSVPMIARSNAENTQSTNSPLQLDSAYKSTDTEKLSAALDVERLLCEGKQSEAINIAMTSGLWSLALIISSSVSRSSFMDIVSNYARESLSHGTALQTLCLSISENDDELIKLSSSKTGVQNWKKTLSVLLNRLSNSSNVDREMRVIEKIGDTLIEHNCDLSAGHLCYIICGKLKGLSMDQGSVVLLGADSKTPCGRPQSHGAMVSILQSVVYETVIHAQNGQQFLHLLPHRLVIVLNLIAIGKLDVALQHVDFIIASVRRALEGPNLGVVANLFTPPFLSLLESTEATLRCRLNGANDASVGKLSALKQSLSSVFKRSTEALISSATAKVSSSPNLPAASPPMMKPASNSGSTAGSPFITQPAPIQSHPPNITQMGYPLPPNLTLQGASTLHDQPLFAPEQQQPQQQPSQQQPLHQSSQPSQQHQDLPPRINQHQFAPQLQPQHQNVPQPQQLQPNPTQHHYSPHLQQQWRGSVTAGSSGPISNPAQSKPDSKSTGKSWDTLMRSTINILAPEEEQRSPPPVPRGSFANPDMLGSSKMNAHPPPNLAALRSHSVGDVPSYAGQQSVSDGPRNRNAPDPRRFTRRSIPSSQSVQDNAQMLMGSRDTNGTQFPSVPGHRRTTSDITHELQASQKLPPLPPKRGEEKGKESESEGDKGASSTTASRWQWRKRFADRVRGVFGNVPKQAHMGERNKFVFDKERNRWIIPGEAVDDADDVPPPPPDDDELSNNGFSEIQGESQLSGMDPGSGYPGGNIHPSMMGMSQDFHSGEQAGTHFGGNGSDSEPQQGYFADNLSETSERSAMSAPTLMGGAESEVPPPINRPPVPPASENKFRAGKSKLSGRRAYVDTFNPGSQATPFRPPPAQIVPTSLSRSGSNVRIYNPGPAPTNFESQTNPERSVGSISQSSSFEHRAPEFASTPANSTAGHLPTFPEQTTAAPVPPTQPASFQQSFETRSQEPQGCFYNYSAAHEDASSMASVNEMSAPGWQPAPHGAYTSQGTQGEFTEYSGDVTSSFQSDSTQYSHHIPPSNVRETASSGPRMSA